MTEQPAEKQLETVAVDSLRPELAQDAGRPRRGRRRAERTTRKRLGWQVVELESPHARMFNKSGIRRRLSATIAKRGLRPPLRPGDDGSPQGADEAHTPTG
jgi:hypothetical protein